MKAKVTQISTSYYWPEAAIVIDTDCGHRHIRPKDWPVSEGGEFDCPFDHDQPAGAGRSVCGCGEKRRPKQQADREYYCEVCSFWIPGLE